MNAIHYIGFDVHKKTIAYCVKTADGQIVEEGTLQAQRLELCRWAKRRQVAWQGAMEATLFSAWIYDTLKPYAQQLSMGHPAKMKAITAGKKKSDCLDARTIADLLRCNLLPACYVLPPHLRDLRRLLRYRNLVVQQSVRMQNKMAGLLMESGAPFDSERLHREEVLRRADEEPAGSTGVGQRSPTYESRLYGDVRVYAETADQETALRSRPGAARRATDEHRRSRSDHGADMGIGGRRPTPLLLYSGCSQLLWLNGGVSILCRQTATGSDFQAAQCLAADGTDRSRQTGAALESATGSTACSAAGARPRQSCHPASSAKAGGLPAGGGQERSTLSGAHSASAAKSKAEKEKTASNSGVSRLREKIRPVRGCWSFLRHADLSPDGRSQLVNRKGNSPKRIPLVTHRSDESGRVSLAGCSPAEPASVSSTHPGYQSYVRSVSDPPAGPRVFCGCARGLRLPIHLTVCFEAGRFTLTQSSWTASARRCSRKWMSGHAGKALVLISDRGQSKTRSLCSLGEPASPGQGESPFPLDHYLSWMSLVLVCFCVA